MTQKTYRLAAQVWENHAGPFVYVVSQDEFDHYAAYEGQTEKSPFGVHQVDRAAGTLMVGGVEVRVAKLLPMEVGVIDRFQIINSNDMAECQLAEPRSKGAQWKREIKGRRS